MTVKLRRMKKVEKQNTANRLTFFGSSGQAHWKTEMDGVSPGRDTAQIIILSSVLCSTSTQFYEDVI